MDGHSTTCGSPSLADILMFIGAEGAGRPREYGTKRRGTRLETSPKKCHCFLKLLGENSPPSPSVVSATGLNLIAKGSVE